MRRPSPLSRSFVLAALRALHLDTGCGLARLATTPRPESPSARSPLTGGAHTDKEGKEAGCTLLRLGRPRLSVRRETPHASASHTVASRRKSTARRRLRRASEAAAWLQCPSVLPVYPG